MMDLDIYSPYMVDIETIMNSPAWNNYASKIINLPISIKKIVVDTETKYFLKSLSERFNLNQEQSKNLSRIIRDLLLSEKFIGNISNILTQRLSLPQESIKLITSRILNELFAPAIEDIKKMQREKFSSVGIRPESIKPPDDINQNNVIDLRNQDQ